MNVISSSIPCSICTFEFPGSLHSCPICDNIRSTYISCSMCTMSNPDTQISCLGCNALLSNKSMIDTLPENTNIANNNNKTLENLWTDSLSKTIADNMSNKIGENLWNDLEDKASTTIPETLVKCNMIFIGATYNNIQLKIFVDTGATTSVMAYSTAKKLGVAHLIDTRKSGKVNGIGTATTIGTISYIELSIGDYLFPCQFIVIDSDYMPELMLGLNIMKAHGCIIDMKQQCITSTSGLKIPFI